MASENISILVVEDEPAIAELVSFSVKTAGWTPVTVYTGTEAWTALAAFSSGYGASRLDVAGSLRYASFDEDPRTQGHENASP